MVEYTHLGGEIINNYSESTVKWILASPIIIIALGWTTATLFSQWVGAWAWVPVALVYWGSCAWFIWKYRSGKQLAEWLRPSGRKAKLAIFLCILFGLIPMSILAMNLNLLTSPLLVVLWLLFALINPWFEELYWRGLLLDRLAGHWPNWLSAIYSTVLFTLSHPLMWGVFSIANRNMEVYLFLLAAGLVWSYAYFKMKSLRWNIFSHFLVDIGNLAVFVFLNLYIPGP